MSGHSFGVTADGRRYSPAVAAMAESCGLDLSAVPLGADPQRVSMQDLFAAADNAASVSSTPAGGSPAAPRAYALPRGAQQVRDRSVTALSQFVSGTEVTIDPWSPNPLLDDLRQVDPAWARTAEAAQPAPTLFESGDLPPFTGSGIDPTELLRVPAFARHAVASADTPAKALTILEGVAGSDLDTARWDHSGAGYLGYVARMKAWAVEGMSDDALYESVNGGGQTAGGAR